MDLLHPADMKKLLTLVLYFVVNAAFTQQKKDKLYVYTQNIYGGVSGYKADSLGNTTRLNSGPSTTYFIYLEVPPQKELQVTELCINGKSYQFSLKEIQTPITRKRQLPGDIKSDTLVNATNQKVYRITKLDEKAEMNTNKKTNASAFPVIIYYTLNGKKHTIKTKEIQKLPQVMMQ